MNEKEILQKLGLENADPALQDRALQSFTNIVDKRTMGIVSELMTQEQRREFEANADSMSQEEGKAWLRKNVADVDEIYSKVEQDYLEEFVKNAEKAQQSNRSYIWSTPVKRGVFI